MDSTYITVLIVGITLVAIALIICVTYLCEDKYYNRLAKDIDARREIARLQKQANNLYQEIEALKR